MGKEVKIGLAVIGVLLCVFGGVLAMRLKREQPSAQEKVAAAEKEGKLKGKKKQVEKPGKDGKGKAEGGPSLGAQLDSFASRSRRDKAASKPKTDRYGRTVADEESTTPADDDTSSDLAAVRQTEAPDARRSPYANRNSSERNSRYSDDGDVRLDPSTEDGDVSGEESADDVLMPEDRFAQRNGGVSFSEGGEADDSDSADEADDQADAPKFSMEQLSDRDPADTDATDEPDAGEPTDEGNADEEPAQASDVNVDVGAMASDGLRARTNTDRRLRGRLPDAAEMVDDADATQDTPEEVADQPRRLAQFEGDSYVVEPNDNFWRISQKVYGTGAYYKALEAHNRRVYGKKPLGVGDEVSVPPIADLQQEFPDVSPQTRDVADEPRDSDLAGPSARGRRVYTVAEGETVFDIARRELGKASRWADIYALNRDQLGEDLNNLSPGMQIELPSRSSRAEATATRSSGDRYQR